MTRAVFFALLVSGVVSVSASRAEVQVAPPPREIRPDGTRDPVPEPEAVKKEDPREIVERIIKNSNAVGEKLAMTDTGTDTRKTQDKILKDIDALLNEDNPPPPKPDNSQDQQKDKKDMNKDDKQDNKKDNKQDNKQDNKKDQKQDGKGGGMGDPSPMGKGMDPKDGGGMGMEPMGGDQPKERRPRQGEQQAKGGSKDDGMKQAGGGGKQPKQDAKGGKTKDPMTGGVLPDPMGDNKMPPSDPLLPAEVDVVKDVWGHLPEKLRQQATQYYKQEIMPRYAELLKRYYSSMAEKKQ